MLALSRALRRMGPWPPTAIAFLGILGLAIVYRGPQAAGVGLDAELSFPAVFSAAVFGCAAIAAFALSLTWAAGTWERRLLVAFGAFLLFFAADEFLFIRERVEELTGIDWEILYLPVGAAGAAIGLAVLWTLRAHRAAVTLLVLAGLAWVVAEGLEARQWDGATLIRPATIYPEQLLEVIGSTLFGTALMLVLRARPLPGEERVSDSAALDPVVAPRRRSDA